MRLAYPLFLLIIFGFVAYLWLSTTVDDSPQREASRFLNDIRSADVIDAVKQFGSNVCHCPAKGGWVSYLIYQSGQEHNLAFMLGRPFTADTPVATPAENNRQALLPWQRPEDYVVDFPIKFEADSYQPYFLPLKMAYGKNMPLSEFNEFLQDPDKNAWQGFTLRLRPSLDLGTVKPPKIDVPHEMQKDFKSYERVTKQALNKGENTIDSKSEIDKDYIRKSFGEDVADYLVPEDAGQVLDENGKPLSEKAVEAQLPKLEKMSLRLHVVRRDKIQNWTIYHFALEQPVLIMPNGKEIVLQHHQRPKNEVQSSSTSKIRIEK